MRHSLVERLLFPQQHAEIQLRVEVEQGCGRASASNSALA